MRRIVLATDLSARCDRAFDRAVLLTRAWNARLTIVTALENWPEDALHGAQPRWRRIDSEASEAESRINDDLRGAGIEADIVVRRGAAAELVLEVAGAAAPDLIVTGIARSTGLSRAMLGSTVEAILRRRVAPVLVVKRRAREPYGNALVGIDFSAGAAAALQATATLFPQAALSVLHAYRETAAGGFAPGHDNDDTAHREAAIECARFVAQTLPEAGSGVRCVAEAGFPVSLLNQYAIDKQIDLLAAGTHGRHLLLELLLGSTSSALVLSSPCDLLLAPASQAGAQ